jgi:hypothetical protein
MHVNIFVSYLFSYRGFLRHIWTYSPDERLFFYLESSSQNSLENGMKGVNKICKHVSRRRKKEKRIKKK